MAGVYMLGDSHTEALGPRLKALLGDGFRYEAFAGYSTSRADAARKINPISASTILVSLGGNDFGDQTAARQKLIARLRTQNPSASILWVGPFQSSDLGVDKRHREQSVSQSRQLPAMGVQWVDGRPLSATLTHVSDGTHFTPSSYSVLADKIASATGDNTKLGLGLGLGFVTVIVGVGWWLLKKLGSR